MRIGEVAEQTGLSADAIRFYERSGLLQEPIRSEGGYRLFRDADVQELRFVRKTQTLGFSLSEIKELMFIRQKQDHACTHVRDLVGMKLEQVRIKISELRILEAALAGSLRGCNRELREVKKSSPHQASCPLLTRLVETRSARRRQRRG